MYSERVIHWLFSQTYVLIFCFNAPTASDAKFFYGPRQLSSRDQAGVLHPLPRITARINYTLDAWSQYENPEEGIAREGDIRERFNSRKTTTTNQKLLWHNGIVRYFLDDSIVSEPEKMTILREAMEAIMGSTCVRFVRIYPDKYGNFPFRTWVNVTGNAPGCFSDLGRINIPPGLLNLDVTSCFRTKGHAIHEILHTLGVYHEHMRPDRDKYIKILWENIRNGEAFNFVRLDRHAVTNYGLPYDYDSIMHYSMTAFSKNRSIPTIVPRKSGAVIGQRDHLSFYDIQKLLMTYKCHEINLEDSRKKSNQKSMKTDVPVNFNTSLGSPDTTTHSDDLLSDYRTNRNTNPPETFSYSDHFISPAEDYDVLD